MHTPSYPAVQAPPPVPPPPAFGLGKLPPPKKSTATTFLGTEAIPTPASLMMGPASGGTGKTLLGQA